MVSATARSAHVLVMLVGMVVTTEKREEGLPLHVLAAFCT